jgi:erythritol kinase
MTDSKDLIVGIDAGTSVMKAVAFICPDARSPALPCAIPITPATTAPQRSRSSQTWLDCVSALRGLGKRSKISPSRTAAIAVTAQGDGTWLVGRDNKPVADAWLWLDARAAPTVERLSAPAQIAPLRGDGHRPQHLPARLAARPYGQALARPARRAETACTARTGSI